MKLVSDESLAIIHATALETKRIGEEDLERRLKGTRRARWNPERRAIYAGSFALQIRNDLCLALLAEIKRAREKERRGK